MIGYWLTQALRNAEVSTPILSAVTQTLLDHADSAFDTPTKFVSHGYTHRRATELASQHGWDIATDGISGGGSSSHPSRSPSSNKIRSPTLWPPEQW